MKKITLLFLITLVFSCNKKVVELPEISHSDITEIKDVSAAYLFYDETQTDSVELNRKNLISTTNWLVNVDKRLTLKQVIPHIKFLQDKKANAGHKNENAKNYFTCHDKSRNNLGFVEFTDVVYLEKGDIKAQEQIKDSKEILIKFHNMKSITYFAPTNGVVEKFTTDYYKFESDIIKSNTDNKYNLQLKLIINPNTTFQEYITFKSKLSELRMENVSTSKYEFIY